MKMNMNKTNILTIILLVLVIVSVVQAVQLTSLKIKLGSNDITTNSGTKVKSTASSGDVAVPKSLDNLTQMVGGC